MTEELAPATGASGPPPRAGRWHDRLTGLGAGWLLLPASLFLAFVVLYPMATMVLRSVTDPSVDNYTMLVETDLYFTVLLQTLQIGLITTLFCLLVGYPYAYLLTRVSGVWRLLLIAAVVLPFWTSWLVRTFAWMSILRDTGVVNEALMSLGVIDEPLSLIRNLTGVTIGMSYIMLPFMILPLYATMTRIDWSLVQAAQSLGANRRQAFLRVFLPLSVPGMLAGSFLVFVVSVGFYVTPALLGSPQNMMLGELIVTRFSDNLEFGQGSALSVVLLAVVGLILLIASRVSPVMRSLQGTRRG